MSARSKTHLSLHYLASYLLLGGIGLVAHPRLALELLQARDDYGVVMPRLVGALLIALGILVVQVIRLRLDVLHTTTLAVRAMLIAVLVSLYVTTTDPLFAILTGIAGLGFVLTGTGYLLDRRAGR